MDPVYGEQDDINMAHYGASALISMYVYKI